MNQACRDYVASVIERYPQAGKRVLEVGACNVNGTVRDLFDGCADYLATDKRPGPGVDLVCDAHDLTSRMQRERMDTAVCCEMLEHDTIPFETLETLWYCLNMGGILIVTTRGIGYPLHDAPEDYWRFTSFGLRLLMEQAGFECIEAIDNEADNGTFGLGIKR